MTAPAKPWEVGANSRSMGSLPGIQNIRDSNTLQSSAPALANPTIPTGVPMNVRRVTRTAPAPPPRPYRPITRQSYIPSAGYNTPYSSYGSYGSGYGGYSGMGYGSNYGGYGSIGGYGMNRFGNNFTGNDPESRFIQMAEESSRPAFQSIESLVQAFGSISFMLESTFNAVYGSFRAVLSVAENFGRLRTLFGQFFSTFAILRTLQWLYRKLLYLLGLRKVNPGREEIWEQAVAGAANMSPGMETKDARSSWPIIMFLGIMFSGPYLVWKLVNSLSNVVSANPYDPKDWNKSKDPTYSAVALYDFVAESNQELNFKAGQKLLIAPKELQPRDMRGWLLATANGSKVGLAPYNYLRIAAVNNSTMQNVQAPVNTQMAEVTVPDQYIPTLNEPSALASKMQTGWVPQPVNPQTQTDWVQPAVPSTQTEMIPSAAAQTHIEPVIKPDESNSETT